MRELGYALFFLGCGCLLIGLSLISAAVAPALGWLIGIAGVPVIGVMLVAGYARFVKDCSRRPW